jgi:hypothetical protein
MLASSVVGSAQSGTIGALPPPSVDVAEQADAHMDVWQPSSAVSAFVHVVESPVAHASAQLVSVQLQLAKHA